MRLGEMGLSEADQRTVFVHPRFEGTWFLLSWTLARTEGNISKKTTWLLYSSCLAHTKVENKSLKGKVASLQEGVRSIFGHACFVVATR